MGSEPQYPPPPDASPPYTGPVAPQPPFPPPPYPPYGQAPYAQPMYPPPMAPYGMVPPRPSGGAIAIEAILAFFGIYGVGWLMSGITTTGAILMIAGFAWDVLAFFGVLFTAGFGLLCAFPLHLAFIAASTITLSNQHPQR